MVSMRGGLSCGSTSSICQGVLKSENLLHKRGFVKTQSLRTVIECHYILNLVSKNEGQSKQKIFDLKLSADFMTSLYLLRH